MIHHIGIVTNDPDTYSKMFEKYGGRIINSGVASEFGVECYFIDMGNIIIELIIPLEHNKIEEYMKQNKSALHHIAISKDKIDNPKNGACGLKVNFKLDNKVLIEEVENDGII